MTSIFHRYPGLRAYRLGFALLCLVSLGIPSAAAKTYDVDAGRIVLGWSPVPGAARYLWQVSPTTDFTNPIAEGEIEQPQIEWRFPEYGQFYLRVAATTASGRAGAWSQPSEILIVPPAPRPLSPANGSTHPVGQTLTLKWQAPPQDLPVELEIENAGRRSLQNLNDTEFTLSPQAGSLSWRLRTRARGANSPWTAGWTVQIQQPPLAKVEWDDPDDEYEIAETAAKAKVDLAWDSVDRATRYEIELKPPVPNLPSQTVTARKWQGSLPPGNYEFRVRAINGKELGPWSDAHAVAITKQAPRVPTKQGPRRNMAEIGGGAAAVELLYRSEVGARRYRNEGQQAAALKLAYHFSRLASMRLRGRVARDGDPAIPVVLGEGVLEGCGGPSPNQGLEWTACFGYGANSLVQLIPEGAANGQTVTNSEGAILHNAALALGLGWRGAAGWRIALFADGLFPVAASEEFDQLAGSLAGGGIDIDQALSEALYVGASVSYYQGGWEVAQAEQTSFIDLTRTSGELKLGFRF